EDLGGRRESFPQCSKPLCGGRRRAWFACAWEPRETCFNLRTRGPERRYFGSSSPAGLRFRRALAALLRRSPESRGFRGTKGNSFTPHAGHELRESSACPPELARGRGR